MARPTKAEVLDAIRRLADENGGTPLGKMRFEAATGITEGEWSGVYWARWSDALAEAGFEPNEFRGAYSDEMILEQLALAVREAGRFPTVPELRIRRAADPSFPNSKVFERLGTKAVRVGRLAEFCSTRSKYADVQKICEELGVSSPSPTGIEDASGLLSGYVYMVKSGTKYKIGRTGELERRISELRYQSPDPVELIHSIRTDDQVGIEDYWKRRFAPRQHREEWYALTISDVRAFKKRKPFM